MLRDPVALRATVHCLTGCAIGEVLGMVLGNAFRWSTGVTLFAAVALAFVFGYAFTLVPLLRAGIAPAVGLRLAFAADTLSIALMEIVDNAVMLVVPGAMDAPLTSPLFWGSLLFSLLLAGVVAFPVNHWLISRGRGHAVVHGAHRRPGAPDTAERGHAAHGGRPDGPGAGRHAGHGGGPDGPGAGRHAGHGGGPHGPQAG